MIGDARSLVAVVAATVLGVAIYVSNQWVAVALLGPAIFLTGVATFGSRKASQLAKPELGGKVRWFALLVGIVLFADSLVKLRVQGSGQIALLILGLIAVAGAGFAVVVLRSGTLSFAVFIGAFLIVALGALAATPGIDDVIDVALFQVDASEVLRDGQNPYSMTFRDIYVERPDKIFYGPGVSENGVLQFGYPYLPLSLLIVAPFQLILGDFRIAHALAILGAAVVISRIRPGKDSQALAVIFLLLSPVVKILVFGWIEPPMILGAALVVFAASRHSRATPYVAGALIALKQYGVLLIPASLLLLPRPWTVSVVATHLVKMGGVVAATVLPFFLWNPGEFTWSVVELQFVQPFRPDSTSFMAAWAAVAGEPTELITTLVPLLALGLATVAVLRWSLTGSQGFALASAFTLLVAFAFSKQAFDNYYILVLGLLFIGAAARNPEDVEPSASPPSPSGQERFKSGRLATEID